MADEQSAEEQVAEFENFLSTLPGVQKRENEQEETQGQQETTTSEAQEAQTTAEEQPANPDEQQEESKDDDWLLGDTPATTEEKIEDWKAKYEEVHGKLSKIEGNKLLKRLADVADSPDFDFEQFLEAHTSKRIDYTKVSLEDLYKSNLKADEIAGYTDEDIEALWEIEKGKLEGSPHLEKSLKADLIRKLQANQPQDEEEPELLKTWKQTKAEKDEWEAQQKAEGQRINEGITSFFKSSLGKKVAGYTITEEDVAEAQKRDLTYYMNPDGKINEQKVAQDRLKASLFDKMVAHLKTTGKKEAVKSITRASTQSGNSTVTNTDNRTQNQKTLDEYAQSRGYKNYQDLINLKKQ